jgi:hypothetical protein
MRPYLKKPFTKKGCGVTQGVGPEFKLQNCKKKEKKKRRKERRKKKKEREEGRKERRAGGMVQVVEHLPSKHKALTYKIKIKSNIHYI